MIRFYNGKLLAMVNGDMRVTGVMVPRRLAALRGKARRFDRTCEKPGMDDVVLDFLR